MAKTTAELVKAKNEYGTYCIPAGLEKRPAAKAAISGKVYEPDTIAFMRKHAGSGDVVHAGTFFGDFLPGLSTSMAKGAKVWAFEPNPGNYFAAKETVKLSKLKNVELKNNALSNRDEEVLFKTKDEDGKSLGGLSHFVTEPGEGIEGVKAAMLDYIVLMDRQVSILQLDVEGHEKQALRGAYHLVNRCKPILILEYLGNTQWIKRTFRGLGYEQVGKLHGNFVYAVPEANITL